MAGRRIGAVLADLQQEFPDLSISKIRFLEAEGLLEPERTGSGYRHYSGACASFSPPSATTSGP